MSSLDNTSIFPRDPRIIENIATLKALTDLIQSLSLIGENKVPTRVRLANERNMITMFLNSRANGHEPCMYRFFKKAYGTWYSYESHHYTADGISIESIANGLLSDSDIDIAENIASLLEKNNHFIEKPKSI